MYRILPIISAPLNRGAPLNLGDPILSRGTNLSFHFILSYWDHSSLVNKKLMVCQPVSFNTKLMGFCVLARGVPEILTTIISLLQFLSWSTDNMIMNMSYTYIWACILESFTGVCLWKNLDRPGRYCIVWIVSPLPRVSPPAYQWINQGYLPPGNIFGGRSRG